MTDTPEQPRWIDYVRLDELPSAPRNPNLHDTESIAGSITRHGVVEPCVLDERTGRLVAGHGRRDDLLDRMEQGAQPPDGVIVDDDGMWKAPVERGWASADDAEAEAYLVASNLQPKWHLDGLAELLVDLQESPLGLAGTGYNDDDVTDLLALTAPPPDLDDLASQLGEPQPEDFWKTLTIKLPPELLARWVSATAGVGGTEADKLAALLERVESCDCS